MNNKQDYKWVIEYKKSANLFLVSGYVWVNNHRWSRDGAILDFITLEDAMVSIIKSEHETSRTQE